MGSNTMSSGKRARLTAGLSAAWLLMGVSFDASGQTMGASASSFNNGYNATSGEMSQAINVSTKDANGNHVIVDGIIQNGATNSVFNKQSQTGVGDTVSGAGASASGVAGSNTAIGNNITVVTQGSNNTVIVNATQTNTGAVTATTVLNGQINLNNGG